jgi:hypothetical protein
MDEMKHVNKYNAGLDGNAILLIEGKLARHLMHYMKGVDLILIKLDEIEERLKKLEDRADGKS